MLLTRLRRGFDIFTLPSIVLPTSDMACIHARSCQSDGHQPSTKSPRGSASPAFGTDSRLFSRSPSCIVPSAAFERDDAALTKSVMLGSFRTFSRKLSRALRCVAFTSLWPSPLWLSMCKPMPLYVMPGGGSAAKQ